MKEIIVVSKTHGTHKIQVDDADFAVVSLHTWHVCKGKDEHTFYARTQIRTSTGQISVAMHQMIFPPREGMITDHRDSNGLNNTRKNLRYCTHSQNKRNRRTPVNNATGFKGVTFNKAGKRFQALISVDGKMRGLGYFQSAVEAAHAYDRAAREHYGEFARLNFPTTKAA